MSNFLQPSSAPSNKPSDMKRHLLFIGVIFIGTFLWMQYSAKEKISEPAAASVQTQAVPADSVRSDATLPSAPVAAAVLDSAPFLPKLPNVLLRNAQVEMAFAPSGSDLVRVRLNDFLRADTDVPAELFAGENMFGAFRTSLSNLSPLSAEVSARTDSTFTVVRMFGGCRLTEQFTLSGSYRVENRITLENTGNVPCAPGTLTLSTGAVQPELYFSGDQAYGTVHTVAGRTTADVNMTANADKTQDDLAAVFKGNAFRWVLSQNKYCASILKSPTPFEAVSPEVRTLNVLNAKGQQAVCTATGLNASWNVGILPPGGKFERECSLFAGPKQLAEVTAFEPAAVEVLQLSYFSWFETLARWMLSALLWINGFCANFGISIIVLTLAIKALFWPVQTKATKSMRKMQEVQPKLKALREEFKDKPELLNSKIMELYRTEGVNPVSGCLPLLLQMPVFIALFAALNGAVELRQESFLWIQDLTRPDAVATLFGFGVHPLILAQTALMILQQKLSPSQADPMQQKMMMFMPVMILVFFYNMPAGLTLYMTVSSIPQIIQQWYMLKQTGTAVVQK